MPRQPCQHDRVPHRPASLSLLVVLALARAAAAQPRIVVEPGQIDFGAITVLTFQSRTLAVRNAGNQPLSVSRLQILDPFGRDPSPWTIPLAPFSVLPGAERALTLEFQPRTIGSFPAEIAIDSDDPLARSTRVPLDGKGVEVSWSVSPRNLAFRSLLVGDVSAPQTVTLANTGLAPFLLFPPRLSGTSASQFRVLPGGATTLRPGEAESYVVTCQPSGPGQHLAQLVLSAGGPLPEVAVSLAATAVATTLANPPVDWSFGDVPVGQPSAPRDFTVRLEPPGIAGRLLAVASSNPLFEVDTSDTRWTPSPDEATSVRVRFRPEAAGEATALLTVIAAGQLGPLLVARLHGRGVVGGPFEVGFCTVAAAAGASRGGGDLLPGLLVLLGLAVPRRRAGVTAPPR